MSDTRVAIPGDLAEEVYVLGVGEDVTLCTVIEQSCDDSGGFLAVNASRFINGSMYQCPVIERTRLTYQSCDRLVLRLERALGDALGVSSDHADPTSY